MKNTREELIKTVVGEDARVQYDDKDFERVEHVAELFGRSSAVMLEALASYLLAMKAPADENSADAMKGARHDLIYAWTTAQGTVSMISTCLRFDGDEAFNRAVASHRTGEDADMNGL
jgi:hypothetical protein